MAFKSAADSTFCKIEKRLMDKLTRTTLIKLQLFYFTMGFGYNLVSYFKTAAGGKALAFTDPVSGGVFMLIYGLCILPGLRFFKTYRVLMALFVLIVGYNGIIKHFIVYSQQPEAYSSLMAWTLAVSINIYGTIINLAAAAGWYAIQNDA